MTHDMGKGFCNPQSLKLKAYLAVGCDPSGQIDKNMLAPRVLVLPVYGKKQLLCRTLCVEVTIAVSAQGVMGVGFTQACPCAILAQG